MRKPRVVIVRSAGTNCDQETKFAFELVGAAADLVHMNEILQRKKRLSSYEILALPGGFTYGDDLGAGKIFANEFRYKLREQRDTFLNDGKLVIGICNGFQILVKSGLLAGSAMFSQEASLVLNDSAKFEDRWTYVRNTPSKCVWTQQLPEIIYLPVAHAEGKFVVGNQATLDALRNNNQVVFRYCNRQGFPDSYPHNPNGSIDDIAGICDATGRVLGLMPHPERHMFFFQHPHWTRLPYRNFPVMRDPVKRDNTLKFRYDPANGGPKGDGARAKRVPIWPKTNEGDGLSIFRNGIEYAKKNLLS